VEEEEEDEAKEIVQVDDEEEEDEGHISEDEVWFEDDRLIVGQGHCDGIHDLARC
jgi:hypothetical protein